jgi:dihydroorotate dehydrogenase (fumarate)
MSLNIHNIIFENPILNASGCWCLEDYQIENLYKSKLSGVITKTCTLHPKKGNPEINYYNDKDNNLHFNCKGLPNNGYQYYRDLSIKYNKKPYIISIAYTTLDELQLILFDYDVFLNENKLVEINMSCPNIESRIYGYHKKDIINLLEMIKKLNLKFVGIGIKLPPYFEIEKINKLTIIFNQYKDVLKFITISNSIPNGLPIVDNKFILSNKYGGISGKINKYIALSNICSFNKNLDNQIKIIGCGGISDINDIEDYLCLGAYLVQIGSSFYNEMDNKLNIDKINDLCIITTSKKNR